MSRERLEAQTGVFSHGPDYHHYTSVATTGPRWYPMGGFPVVVPVSADPDAGGRLLAAHANAPHAQQLQDSMHESHPRGRPYQEIGGAGGGEFGPSLPDALLPAEPKVFSRRERSDATLLSADDPLVRVAQGRAR